MQKTVVLLLVLFLFGRAWAQSGLYIQPTTTFVVSNGTLLSVDGLSITPSGNFTITAPNSLVRNNTISYPNSNPYIRRVFDWGSSTPLFSGTIRIDYLTNELNGIPQNKLTLNIHNGVKWQDFPGGVTRDPVNHFVSTTGISTISLRELTLGNLVTPLPLVWGPVDAYRDKSNAVIKWITYQEQNVKEFIVQRSSDGTVWVDAGRVPATNTSSEHQYSLSDPFVTSAMTFYRIRQNDQDGVANYSVVVSVKAVPGKQQVMVWPNPVRTILNIRVPDTDNKINSILLYHNQGGLIYSEKVNGTGFQLNMNHLPAGFYLLEIRLTDQTIFYKTVKQ